MQKRKQLTKAEQRAAVQAIRSVNFRDMSGNKSVAEQVEHVKQAGVWPPASYLRRVVWQAAGGRDPKPTADNLIFFGCMRVFWQADLLVSYLALLDRLGVDYTFLRDSEYCCGSGIIQDTLARGTPEEQQMAWDAGRQFSKLNIDQGRALDVKSIYYFCQGCGRQALYFFPQDAISQRYHLDPVVDHIEQKKIALRLKTPMTVGYYQGCWRKYDYLYPGMGFNLNAYRELAGRIQGLEIRDITSTICCWTSTRAIFARAEKVGVDTIVTVCAACHRNLDRVASKGLPFRIKMLHEIVLEALPDAPA